MRRFTISKQLDLKPPITKRVSTVMRMFGVGIDRFKDERTTHKADLEVEDGNIVYITGPSGAGKSVLLREMQNGVETSERISIDEIQLPADKAAIDCINGDLSTIAAMGLLGNAGLSDVFCVLTAPANLSEGQKYRFRLAATLAATQASGKKVIFADEFCSNLDRITAAVIAYNIRRFAKRNNVTFILASSREDILADLQPDVLVVKHFTGPAEVTYKKLRSKN